MQGGRGEVGYEIVVEGTIEFCIFPETIACRPTCSNGWQTVHSRPIAVDLTENLLNNWEVLAPRLAF